MTDHMVARFLGVKVWELDQVALHYQEEAAIVLQARWEARSRIAKKGGSGMSGAATIALPDF